MTNDGGGSSPPAPGSPDIVRVRVALAEWGVQVEDEVECAELALRLRVLLTEVQQLMVEIPDDPGAFVPDFLAPGKRA